MKHALNTFCIFILTICMSQAQSKTATKETAIYRDFKTEHVWDAKVTIANGINLGNTKHGGRNIIPITGGTFEGPHIRGGGLPDGADWRLVRPGGGVAGNARCV